VNTDNPATPGDAADSDPGASTPRRRRRVRGLSIRMLMLVVLVVGGWLGWICYRARVQREAVAAIVQAEGRVYYDWQVNTVPRGKALLPNPKGRSKWPHWVVAQ
jgi:hypothetical protein